MRISDYLRLARIGVKSRKKSTRNTVFGIAFGLAVLIPVLFFTLAFYADLVFTVNDNRAMSTLFLPYTQTRSGTGSSFAMGEEDFLKIAAMPAVSEVVSAELYSLYSAQSYQFSLNGTPVFSDYSTPYFTMGGIFRIPFRPVLKVIDTEKSGGKLVPNGSIADMGGTSLLKYGEGFTDGEGEILLSEPFVRAWGMDPEEVVGQKFTLTATATLATRGMGGAYYLDNNTDPDDAFVPHGVAQRAFTADLFRDFTVCGIIDEDYYACNSLTLQDAHIWLSSASALAPPTVRIRDGRSIVTYPFDFAEINEIDTRGKFLPAVPAVCFVRHDTQDPDKTGLAHEAPIKTAYVQCRDFNGATQVYAAYEQFVRAAEPDIDLNEELGVAVLGFTNLRIFNTVCNYIMVVMFAFGGTVLLATLLNLFNSVNYSVQKRKYYFGMLQAVGAKESVVPRLCFFEVLLIFALALPWASLLGAGLSYGAKWLVDYFFTTAEGQAAAVVFTASVSLDFGWFFLALAIVFLFALAVSLLFSAAACRGAIKKDIVQSLATEQSQ